MSEVENVEVDQAQAEAEFNAGFASVRGDEPPAEVAPVVETVAEPVADVEPEPEQEPEAEDDPVIAGLGMPASQVKALLAKAADMDGRDAKIYGKFGELQRTLNDFQGLRDDIKQLKESGNKAGGAELSAKVDDLLENVKAEYPELGALLAKDLAKLSTGQQPVVDVDGIVNQRVQVVLDKIELVQIKTAHPDWQEIRGSNDFSLWKSGLNQDVQQRLDTSRESEFINEGLTAFKAWRDKSKPQVTTQDKTNRLANAVTPNGIPASTVSGKTPEQEFNDGFNAVRGRRF